MEQLYLRLERTVRALQANRMDACWFKTKAEALQRVSELIPADATATCGGSMTLAECGIMDWLRAGHCKFLDREAVPREKIPSVYRAAFSSDVYLMSSNAVTETGELYNVDGNGNRVAALIYGPASVIVVAGANKLVPDIPAAIRRVKSLAAPVNAARLKQDTPCVKCGTCAGLRGDLAAGCRSEQRICCSYAVSGYQRVPGRIKVILVAETLGY
ncbi:MAG: lactate utilization protein [Oscillospiraceae bacterium]|nr:lactate utilization protein [Oscillospiraceae bacterium]MCR5306239.1 lactate utilization protein [Oscillospiraceae bacterium]